MVTRAEAAALLEFLQTMFLYYMEISAIFIYVWTEKLYRFFVPRPLKSLANEVILVSCCY